MHREVRVCWPTGLRVPCNGRPKSETDPSFLNLMLEFHKVYSKGGRYNCIDEDLGPVNGPFPLQEVIKAAYVYVAFMLGVVATARDEPVLGADPRAMPGGQVRL